MLWMIFENEASRRFRCDSDGRLQGAKWGALDSPGPLKLSSSPRSTRDRLSSPRGRLVRRVGPRDSKSSISSTSSPQEGLWQPQLQGREEVTPRHPRVDSFHRLQPRHAPGRQGLLTGCPAPARSLHDAPRAPNVDPTARGSFAGGGAVATRWVPEPPPARFKKTPFLVTEESGAQSPNKFWKLWTTAKHDDDVHFGY